jgi:hypothetical protein
MVSLRRYEVKNWYGWSPLAIKADGRRDTFTTAPLSLKELLD